ncbi:MAG: FAD:protein FMN transferase [Ruthenibacterium lactatiformans]
MDAVADQKVYGPNGEKAIAAAEQAFREMENRLSVYKEGSDIARLNAAAGSGEAVAVEAQTYALLSQAKTLSAQAGGAFELTIAPLALAWGITTDAPRVLQQDEIDALLPLVDDSGLLLESGTARLQRPGQAVDLGGIAKGAACDVAKEVYDEYGIRAALCWLGGSSIYARGVKPDGEAWRLGFRDPKEEESVSLASFEIRDAVFCTSGGYERYFEQDGVRYHHILDPATGRPAQSDIVSIGILCENGAEADFWSTALFVQGREKALEYFETGGEGLLLDEDNTLYVSKALQASFELAAEAEGAYHVVFL